MFHNLDTLTCSGCINLASLQPSLPCLDCHQSGLGFQHCRIWKGSWWWEQGCQIILFFFFNFFCLEFILFSTRSSRQCSIEECYTNMKKTWFLLVKDMTPKNETKRKPEACEEWKPLNRFTTNLKKCCILWSETRRCCASLFSSNKGALSHASNHLQPVDQKTMELLKRLALGKVFGCFSYPFARHYWKGSYRTLLPLASKNWAGYPDVGGWLLTLVEIVTIEYEKTKRKTKEKQDKWKKNNESSIGNQKNGNGQWTTLIILSTTAKQASDSVCHFADELTRLAWRTVFCRVREKEEPGEDGTPKPLRTNHQKYRTHGHCRDLVVSVKFFHHPRF